MLSSVLFPQTRPVTGSEPEDTRLRASLPHLSHPARHELEYVANVVANGPYIIPALCTRTAAEPSQKPVSETTVRPEWLKPSDWHCFLRPLHPKPPPAAVGSSAT